MQKYHVSQRLKGETGDFLLGKDYGYSTDMPVPFCVVFAANMERTIKLYRRVDRNPYTHLKVVG